MTPDNRSLATADSRKWLLLTGAWLVAAIATLGALFIGEVMGQTPCVLCWYQRICMFPLAVMLGIAALRSDFDAWRYALPLSLAGLGIALFHTLLYFGVIPEKIQPCTASGPSCAGMDMTILGALPIPLLSVAAFLAINLLLILVRKRNRP